MAISLSLLILAPQVMQAGLMVHYSLNIKSIEEAYCVNKDKPQLECHGSCHLKSQLSQVSAPKDESPTEGPSHPINLRVSVYDFNDLQDFKTNPLFSETNSKVMFAPCNRTLSGFGKLLTPPPRFSC